ncbi:MAG: NUDIX hydrolase [Proteobacteria bacterium]|nr:NUDIX hydrolase [Pseudomonadota bacterium]
MAAPSREAPGTKKKHVRPKDAATLVLIRRSNGGAEILMGRRRQNHMFMPNVFVFPGGRVDAADARVRTETELRDDIRTRLTISCSDRRARTLALSAIRETAEETGVLVGIPSDLRQKNNLPAAWQSFAAAGLAPALDRLDYVARAITPPGNARRFHARFFVTDASGAEGSLKGDGELDALSWVPIDDVKDLPTAWITRFVTNEVKQRLEHSDGAQDRPIPVIKFRKIVEYD